MPTISGMRRRGYTPESIRLFAERVGVAKKENLIELAMLEDCVREDLNKRAPRFMGVLNPIRVIIENYPDDKVEEFQAVNNPEDPSMGSRRIPFSRVLYIEKDDFREDPPAKFYRLAPGREVRLRYGYFIKCVDFKKDPATGEIIELNCTYDPETLSNRGSAPDGRKVKATIHWVSAAHSIPAEVRLYEPLFAVTNPSDVPEGSDFKMHLNPESLKVLKGCRIEPSLGNVQPGFRCQFERQGYFCVDPDSARGSMIFNRTVTLRDEWARIERIRLWEINRQSRN
jgi:glutaminyl-tRNA synthetase